MVSFLLTVVAQVDRYVNLLELDANNRRVVDPTKVYQGLTGRVFRCIDTTNGAESNISGLPFTTGTAGQLYCLRKLEAFQPSGKLEMAPLERWKSVMPHAFIAVTDWRCR